MASTSLLWMLVSYQALRGGVNKSRSFFNILGGRNRLTKEKKSPAPGV
ncbi:hypothetical protein SRB521_01119 [Intestinimonas butyriciproducens]|nr:hypothetical protein SRB521_01119 [Intestinimonas butyriciproducens]